MYPNTFMMQELVRQDFDQILDREEGGQQVEMPYIYTVPRGKHALLTLCSLSAAWPFRFHVTHKDD